LADLHDVRGQNRILTRLLSNPRAFPERSKTAGAALSNPPIAYRMTPLQLLIAARARIADPAHWTQFAMARDSEGQSVAARSPRAVSWCMTGALSYYSDDASWWSAYLRLSTQVDYGRLVEFGNTHTHAEVLAAFDRAIAQLETTP
jgi:hypothetical protein